MNLRMIPEKDYTNQLEELIDDIMDFSEIAADIEHKLYSNDFDKDDLIRQTRKLLNRMQFISFVYNNCLDELEKSK